MIPGPEHSPAPEGIMVMGNPRTAASDRRRAANDNERRLDRRGRRHVSLEERLLAELSYGYPT